MQYNKRDRQSVLKKECHTICMKFCVELASGESQTGNIQLVHNFIQIVRHFFLKHFVGHFNYYNYNAFCYP